MLKKAVLVAPLALLAVGSAQAQLSIYGLLDLSYGKSIDADIKGQRADFHSGGDNGGGEGNSVSRIGIKGGMDVGSGVKANFKLESNGITSEGDIPAPFFQRQAWAGFSGSFGEVRLGRQNSVPFDVQAGYDFNGASNGVSAGAFSGVGPFMRGRQSRQLRYLTPDMGGVTAQVALQPKGNVANAKDVFSAGLNYTTGPLSLGAALQTKSATGKKDDFYSFTGTYDFQVVKVMAGYADGGKSVNGGSGKGPMLGLNATVGGFNIGGYVAENTDSGNKVSAYELWLNKEVFKNVYAYVELGQAKFKTAGTKGNGYAVGTILTF